MPNVVSIDTHPARLRVGEMALHPEYGWVEIVARAGSRRRIRWIERPPNRLWPLHTGGLETEPTAVWEDWVEGSALKAPSSLSPARRHGRHAFPALARSTTSPADQGS
jgi:hypothetical protein